MESALHTGTVEESRAIQRRILEQLGLLTELEDLYLFSSEVQLYNQDVLVFDDELGRERNVDSGFQLACLELSLARGLDLLAGLQSIPRQT